MLCLIKLINFVVILKYQHNQGDNMKLFNQYEEQFIEEFSNEFMKINGNQWAHESPEIPIINVINGELPAITLKREFPSVYTNYFNNWFDMVHPY
jgi:hypothetical protein